jgi:hypothetical protein
MVGHCPAAKAFSHHNMEDAMTTLTPGESQPGFTELFAQLGLPNDEASIQQFIRQHHPLADDLQLHDAPFWSPQQAQMLKEKIRCDDDWAIVVDQLSLALRKAPELHK